MKIETHAGAAGAESLEISASGGEDLEATVAVNEATLAPFRVPGRLRVARTYKMFVGGAFVRSESGRFFQVQGADEAEGADPKTMNMPLGSRKDVRDAVTAARAAFEKWSARTAMNRGQILYRLAETMDGRRDELVASLVGGGLEADSAGQEVAVAVDRVVYYAGFCDKFQSLLASSNPVAGPHFAFSVPEPMGIIGVIAPDVPALLGLVTLVLPILAGGNVAVAIASARDPRTAILFCECVATSDVPAGVLNVLTGMTAELAPQLARHRDVNGLRVWTDDGALRTSLESDASGSVKRVVASTVPSRETVLGDAAQGLGEIERFLETKSVWHPIGL